MGKQRINRSIDREISQCERCPSHQRLAEAPMRVRRRALGGRRSRGRRPCRHPPPRVERSVWGRAERRAPMQTRVALAVAAAAAAVAAPMEETAPPARRRMAPIGCVAALSQRSGAVGAQRARVAACCVRSVGRPVRQPCARCRARALRGRTCARARYRCTAPPSFRAELSQRCTRPHALAEGGGDGAWWWQFSWIKTSFLSYCSSITVRPRNGVITSIVMIAYAPPCRNQAR